MKCTGFRSFPDASATEIRISDGQLALVLCEWIISERTRYFGYPSRRGMLLAVRALLNLLAQHLLFATTQSHYRCQSRALTALPSA